MKNDMYGSNSGKSGTNFQSNNQNNNQRANGDDNRGQAVG